MTHAPDEPTTVAHDLFELETPILKARHLAEAIRIMASSDELRGETGDALATLAQVLLIEIDHVKDARDEICQKAGAGT